MGRPIRGQRGGTQSRKWALGDAGAGIGKYEQFDVEREAEIKRIEETMSAAGFYDDREAAQPIVDRHQDLMWEVGDLMSQWEALQ